MKRNHFKCTYCGSTFVTEDRYLKHHCKQMKRAEEMKSPIGQGAWAFYQAWMKAYKRMVPHIDSFTKSKYYQSFIRFAEHVKKLNIPDPEAFIALMKDKDISPTIWTNDQVYAMYLEYLDRRASPTSQAQITIDTLFKIADAADCETSEVFDILTGNEIIVLLRERRLSPWILLFSKKFKNMLIHNVTDEQRIIMESIIRPRYWTAKFKKRPEDVATMRKYVEELDI